MATQTIVLPDLSDTSDGLCIQIQRTATGATILTSYTHPGTLLSKGASVDPSELTSGQRAALTALVQAILAIAKPRMGF